MKRFLPLALILTFVLPTFALEKDTDLPEQSVETKKRNEKEKERVVRKLEQTYSEMKGVKAKFEQTYHSFRFGKKETSGIVKISKPGKMRWDYNNPAGRVLASDGKKIILYDPEDEQALVGDQPEGDELPVALAFLWGKVRLDETFDVTVLEERIQNGERVVVLRCDPKQIIPNTEQVILTVNTSGARARVVESIVVDSLGGRSELRFSDFQWDPVFPKDIFDYSPPEGTPIVQMSSDGLRF